MITRYIFTGYHETEHITPKNNPEISHLSVFTYGEKMFMYFESENPSVVPETVIDSGLKAFPDGTLWMRMPDVFHYAKPLSKEHWERKEAVKEPMMRLMYLKDDMVGSYVFYHQQYKEVYPGDGDKYGIIGLLGNMLAFYCELPCEHDSEATGRLSTTNSPFTTWGEVMEQHFRIEPGETEGTWKQMKQIY